MRFSFRGVSVAIATGALIFFCSCEKHHVGEVPEVQKEHVDLANGDAPTAAHSPTPVAKPTPAEFFREEKPQ